MGSFPGLAPGLAPEKLWQAINPWTWWTSGTGQVGLVNINQMASSNPDLEADIVQNVAGYGKQLGRVSEALAVIIGRVGQEGLNASQLEALKDFKTMTDEIAAVKKGHLAPTTANIDRLLNGIRSLGDPTSEEVKRLLDALRQGIASIERG
jgi:hypothetical protein